MPHVSMVAMSGFRVREREMIALGMQLPGLAARAGAVAALPALGLLTLAGMTPENWSDPLTRCVGALYSAAGFDERDQRGELITDDDFLLITNAYHEPIDFRLPSGTWRACLDTGRGLDPGDSRDEHRERFVIQGRSLALLTRAPA